MSYSKNLIKLQFKIDHASLPHRAGFLCGALIVILVPWLFLSYLPQSNALDAAKQRISELKNQTLIAKTRQKAILALAQQDETKQLIVKYEQVKAELEETEQQLRHYHDGYIDEKKLAKIFYSTILNDINDISIENFKTLTDADITAADKTKHNAGQVLSSASSVKPVLSTPSQASRQAYPQPTITRYSLSLKGDYFSILRTLKRLEDLKWQLFWDKFNYEVTNYPQAVAKIEFYMLKLDQVKNPSDASTGASA